MTERSKTSTTKQYILQEEGASDECGCPERAFNYEGVDVIIHLEEDGTGEAFLDTGDWEKELSLPGGTLDDLEKQVMGYIDSLPTEDGL